MRYSIESVLVCALLLLYFPLSAQVETNGANIETYRFNASVPVVECSSDGTPNAGATPVSAPSGAQFLLIDERSYTPTGASDPQRVIVLQFLQWKETSPYYNVLNVDPQRPIESVRTFCVDRTVFQRTAERIYDWGWSSWDLAAGVLILPIKMRLGGDGRPFDFSRDITLGTVAGPRWRLSPTRDVYLSALIGAGITAVALDAASTNGKVTEPTDRAAATLTLGLMTEVNRFQIGFSVGWDRISNPNQADWLYQGQPWLSIGLGYNLLSEPSRSPATGQ